MRKILSKWRIENAYTVLELDGELPFKKYSKYLIEGKEYEPVSMYELSKHIAVKEDEDFVGKVVEFI